MATSDDSPPWKRHQGEIIETEIYWRDRQQWLLERGYQLRPRYRVDWKPSWEGTDKQYNTCEDGRVARHPAVLDAVRQSDGAVVVLKKTKKSTHPYEAEIARFLSSSPLISDPRNHCVPICEALQDPIDEDIVLLVMPLLRLYDEPRFETVGEAVEFFHQMIEGMAFMHQHHVAHRDCSQLNTMMEPTMYPELYHPVLTTEKPDLSGDAKCYTRIRRPTKYYYVDFGLSRKYDPKGGPPLEPPILGGDKTVPEFKGIGYNKLSNPFPTDIYYLGNLFRQGFLQRYRGLEFMDALVADMVQEVPEKRPTIEQVAERFAEIQSKLSWWKLRSEIVRRHYGMFIRFLSAVRHVYRTAGYVVMRLPPTPTPPS
ncbi:hypothetical protein SCP_0302660 [Sparassis crispa]|uniref:Protein kinase domain-containing protein n=1 Tax=Sparassis crispa TaxID=139825 RepID=A0A401GEI8_9APHY|nr:hypothetical protein SCP_0302660 [Sparassis crispa]GBE80551.1 hypothetical protein SCP_0302660 [Sparassis crispa]